MAKILNRPMREHENSRKYYTVQKYIGTVVVIVGLIVWLILR